jgi:hypothetical protein
MPNRKPPARPSVSSRAASWRSSRKQAWTDVARFAARGIAASQLRPRRERAGAPEERVHVAQARARGIRHLRASGSTDAGAMSARYAWRRSRRSIRLSGVRRDLGAKWIGRCTACGAWNTVIEEAAPTKAGRCGARSAPMYGPYPTSTSTMRPGFRRASASSTGSSAAAPCSAGHARRRRSRRRQVDAC